MKRPEASETEKTASTPRIERPWCKGCGICVHFCPKQVLELDSEWRVRAAHPEACIGCRMCEMRCPDLAIEIIGGDDESGGEESDE